MYENIVQKDMNKFIIIFKILFCRNFQKKRDSLASSQKSKQIDFLSRT